MPALEAADRLGFGIRLRLLAAGRPALVSAWQFASGNLVLNVCSVIWTLALPKQLAVDQFAEWRLFLLYSGLVGVLHLGLLDALLYRWARRNSCAVAPGFWSVVALVGAEGALMLLLVGLLSYTSHPGTLDLRVALPLAVFAASWNVITVAQYALQAKRSFGSLSAFTACQALLFLGAVLSGVMRSPSWIAPAWVYTGSNVLAALVFLLPAIRAEPSRPASLRRIGRLSRIGIRQGFSILFVNLLLLLIVNADRFTVSLRFSKKEFAVYAFGASLVGLGSSAAVVASRFLVPFIARWYQEGTLQKKFSGLNVLMFAGWTALVGCGLSAEALILRQYPAYSAALRYAAVMCIGLAFSCPVQILHLTFARVSRRLTHSTAASVIAAAVGVALMTGAAFHGSMIWIAGAGAATFMIWWLLGVVFVLPRARWIALNNGAYAFGIAVVCAGSALAINNGMPPWLVGCGCLIASIGALVRAGPMVLSR